MYMGRYIFPIIILLGLGTWAITAINHSLEDDRQRDIKKAAQIAQAAIVKENIIIMAKRTNAMTDWPERLTKFNKPGNNRILTIDIQNLWMNNQPILFIGSIDDIELDNNGNYTIKINNGINFGKDLDFDSRLRLIVTCNTNVGRHLITTFKKNNSDGYSDDIALVVNINKIEQSKERERDGEDSKIFNGYGSVVDLIHFSQSITW